MLDDTLMYSLAAALRTLVTAAIDKEERNAAITISATAAGEL